MAGYIGNRRQNNLVSLTGATGTISDDVVFPAGHVIQIENAVSSSEVANWTNNTWVDSGLSVNITPKFNDSKIYLHSGAGVIVANTGYMGLRINRSSPSATALLPMVIYQSNAQWSPGQMFYIGMDTPNTTSQCTYVLQIYKGTGSSLWNYDALTTPQAHLIAMEIKQ